MSTAQTAVILNRTINATRFIYFLYQVLQIAFSPALVLYLLYRGLRNAAYLGGVGERFGFLRGFPESTSERTAAETIWLHAVSVGEVISAVELVRRVKDRRPGIDVYVSTTTLAGRATAEQRLAGLADGIFFAPFDYRSIVRRVLRHLRPKLVVVMETEIWPNLYRESKRAGAALLVVNGRISDRALPSYRRWSGLFRHVLQWPDRILTQGEEDARRYRTAGAPVDRVRATGNLKYDFQPPGLVPDTVRAFLRRAAPEEVWVAASTMPPATSGDVDEDNVVLEAFARLAEQHARLLLILAPRRPEQFEVVAGKLRQAGIRFVRRSELAGDTQVELPGVLLLDTIGELASVFQAASVVFMGGTLASRGGHNVLEPAYFAKPVIAGPHMENFAEIAEEFTRAGALVRIDDAGGLAAAVERILSSEEDARKVGEAARELANSKRGVVDRVVEEVLELLGEAVPDPQRTLAARVVLRPFACAWAAGHRLNLTRGRAAARALPVPVISVGGLAMGGTGKSPVVAHLASRLAEQGRNPAILTRGYRRRSGEDVVVPRGSLATVDETGDEAQMFVRRGVAHVGVGADRYRVGMRVAGELSPDLFLLDDGFQHVRLKRDHDIVLLDALDPLAGGLFPVGRRREPLAGLARATEIIITRCEEGRGTAGIERLVREYNANAPIYRARTVAGEVVGRDGTAMNPGRLGPVAAFCGLGNPRSFWRTLESMGLHVRLRQPFADHHRYGAADVEVLMRKAREAGASALMTTEKDWMNLEGLDWPSQAASGGGGPALPVYHLRIGIEIEGEAELLRRLM